MSEEKHESFMEKVSDKIHGRDSSSSSSDDEASAPSAAHVPPPEVVPAAEVAAVDSPSSPSLKSHVFRLFGRKQPVHKLRIDDDVDLDLDVVSFFANISMNCELRIDVDVDVVVASHNILAPLLQRPFNPVLGTGAQLDKGPHLENKTNVGVVVVNQDLESFRVRGAADVFLWRNKKISATVLSVATVIWFLFELLEYHLLTLVCHILIFTLAVLFLWSNASTFINKSPPRIPDVHIPENALLEFASALRYEINRGLAVLRDIASGKDLKKFLGVIAGLWVLSVVGGWFNFLTLVYLLFVMLHTLPVLYEKYEDQVDAFAEKATIELKKHYAVVDEKVLSKIPRGPLKDKKVA
ncbi:hypothetical protein KSS87_010745 [Heliosperma pusillum]|nr:hypothetical protein KSS87_010745 [Heliosperma pusillum]